MATLPILVNCYYWLIVRITVSNIQKKIPDFDHSGLRAGES